MKLSAIRKLCVKTRTIILFDGPDATQWICNGYAARPAIVDFIGIRRAGALRKVAMWVKRYAAAERLGMEDEGMSARATARAEGASASPTGQDAPETPHPTQSRGGGEK